MSRLKGVRSLEGLMASPQHNSSQPADAGAKVVRPTAFQRSDEALVEAIVAGDVRARQELYDRYAPHLQRVLVRCLGAQREIADATQDVFEQAFRSLSKLRDPTRLKAWLTRVAVYVARGRIRRARRGRWLRFFPPEQLPERQAPATTQEAADALEDTYRILQSFGADERIAFALRFIEGMELKEVADAAGCSLATIKRRLRRAEDAFVAAAKDTPSLRPWIEGGSRWD